jgi:hypothetical protein
MGMVLLLVLSSIPFVSSKRYRIFLATLFAVELGADR